MKENILAIDIGSNTIKCLMAKKTASSVREIFSLTENSRICAKGSLVADASDRIVAAIKIFLSKAQELDVEDFDVVAIATSALRGAENKDEICNRVCKETGVHIRVIDGEYEAFLSMTGALSDSTIPKFDKAIFIDLGGGSLECGYAENGKILKLKSLLLGAVRLATEFQRDITAPLDDETIQKIKRYCKKELKKADFKSSNKAIIATGGAVAAAKYMGKSPNKEALTYNELKFAFAKLAKISAKERAELYNVEAARADIIPAAFICLLCALNHFLADKIYYTKQSLRWGIVFEYFRASF